MSADVQRRRRRRTLFVVGAVPSLLLLVLSARIVVLLSHQGDALEAYLAGEYEQSGERFADNQVLNPVQRWVAPLGAGDAAYRLGDFDRALTEFEASLRHVPDKHECDVRVNLALAHEALGDEALSGGKTDGAQEAQDAWLQGRLALRPCVERPDAVAEVTLDRVVRVDARLARKLGPVASVVPREPRPVAPADDETRMKEREVQERNRQGHADRVEHQDDFDAQLKPTPPPPDQPPPAQW